MGATDRKQITGDYYFQDNYESWQWAIAAILLVIPVTTPLGAFIAGYMVVDGIETE